MFKAENWDEYTLLDATDGERLERWGKYTLVRPDPQVIWKTGRDAAWEHADGVYKRAKSGGGSWEAGSLPGEWTIKLENMPGEGGKSRGYTFSVSPMGFKHTGVFPEQKANWDWFMPLIANAKRPVRILNLFAYTGCASVAAAGCGASVCHVDASKGIVARAKRNAELSDIPSDRIRYIVDDCLKFVEREIRRGNKYDAIIMDPPSYGRGSGGEVWKMEDMADFLVDRSALLLSDNPLFYLLNSYTTGLSASSCAYIVGCRILKRFGGSLESGELGLRVKKTGLFLPCGSAARVDFRAAKKETV